MDMKQIMALFNYIGAFFNEMADIVVRFFNLFKKD